MKLSIIIPVFNEEKTISDVLKKIDELSLGKVSKEVVIVDDGSKDATVEKIKGFFKKHSPKGFSLYQHKENKGKGAAIKTAIEKATGDYVIIQDADLEYDPQDIVRLLSGIKNGNEVIYGTRLKRLPHFAKEEKTGRFMMHYLGNKFLSLVTSLLYGQWLTDMETCYKLFPKKSALKMNIRARGFEFEPEITAKLIKAGFKIHEMPITTKPRGYTEGKKLDTFKDGRKALWTLFKYRFVN